MELEGNQDGIQIEGRVPGGSRSERGRSAGDCGRRGR